MSLSGITLNTYDREPQTANSGECQVIPRIENSALQTKPSLSGYTMTVEQIDIPFEWYGLPEGANVYQLILVGGVTIYTGTLTPGTYNEVQLAALIQADLIANTALGVATWTATYNVNTARLTIEDTSGTVDFRVAGFATAFNANEAFGVPENDTGAELDSVSSVWTSPRNMRAVHARFVYVVVEWPGVNTAVTATRVKNGVYRTQTGARAVVAVASVPETWRQKCTLEFVNKPYFRSTLYPQGPVGMALFDHDWEPIDMNGCDWSVKLGIYDTGGGADWLNTVQMADDTSARMITIPDTTDTSFKEVLPSEKFYAKTRRNKRPADFPDAPRGQAGLKAQRWINPFQPQQM